MIIVTYPSRPLQLTAKRTIRRQFMLNEYADEIAFAYKAVEDVSERDVEVPTSWSEEACTTYVRKIVKKILRGKEIGDKEDFFQIGVESTVNDQRRSRVESGRDCCAVLDSRKVEAVRSRNVYTLARNGQSSIGDVKPLHPEIVVLPESWIRMVAMQEEVRYKLVVTCPEVHVPDGHGRVAVELRLVNS